MKRSRGKESYMCATSCDRYGISLPPINLSIRSQTALPLSFAVTETPVPVVLNPERSCSWVTVGSVDAGEEEDSRGHGPRGRSQQKGQTSEWEFESEEIGAYLSRQGKNRTRNPREQPLLKSQNSRKERRGRPPVNRTALRGPLLLRSHHVSKKRQQKNERVSNSKPTLSTMPVYWKSCATSQSGREGIIAPTLIYEAM
jgi:hypothetical protein